MNTSEIVLLCVLFGALGIMGIYVLILDIKDKSKKRDTTSAESEKTACDHDWQMIETPEQTGYSEYGGNSYLHTVSGTATYRCSKCNEINTDTVVLEDTTEGDRYFTRG